MTDPIAVARDIQQAAADPRRSVLLEAAAGAGKTTVLVDRYLRLCLTGEGGDPDPRAILAITFTRKATVEIQARVQARARRLVGVDLAARTAELARSLGRAPSAAEVDRAAWLHERLFEDPAGLGIETMHAFCQRLLGRFAAEAGLDPRFVVVSEQDELAYRTEALDHLELELARDTNAAAGYAALAETPGAARQRLAGLFDRRVHLQRWIDRVCPPPASAAGALGRSLSPCLDALVGDLQEALLAGTPLAGPAGPDDAAPSPLSPSPLSPSLMAPSLIAALAEFAGPGLDRVADCDRDAGLTDALSRQLDAWRQAADAARAQLVADADQVTAAVALLQDALLTSAGDLRVPKGRNATKEGRRAALAGAAAPVLTICQQADLLDLLADNAAFLRHGLRALDLYEQAKRRDRVVDFQDLEYLALRLLSDPASLPQVHERLDARLAHLLLDEFQDTNRNQWELLAPLLAEVLAGGEPPRTALVVGDVKQSIYGFRGAEPGVFRQAGEAIARQAGPQAVQQLPTNFRSLPAIVQAVGELCQQPPLVTHLGAEAAGARQQVARREPAGEVVCVHPFMRQDDRSGHERAAAATVGLIAGLLDHGGPLTGPGAGPARPLRHDEILVLARNKTHLPIYEAALRRAGIPFTPAGRGLLARCREVQDVLALVRWLTCPVDDVAGATVLRSPLCRLPEDLVQDLLAARGAGRRGRRRLSLREVLGERRHDPLLKDLVVRLETWFGHAGLMPLHDLLRRLYREGDVLVRFELAHGEQARFNLLRLCELALLTESRGGSLRDFVAELDRADAIGGAEEGALPAESGSGRVRVMTVHGAKGLQSPVVILVDAATPLRDATSELLLAPWPADGPWVHGVVKRHWQGPGLGDDRHLPGPLAAPREQARARLFAEEAHVLYVALTRACDRLVVLGGCNDRQSDDQTAQSFLGWLAAADAAAPASGVVWLEPGALPDGMAALATAEDDTAARAAAVAARHERWTPPSLAPRHVIVRPSQLDPESEAPPAPIDVGADAEPGADTPIALRQAAGRRDNPATRRGSRVHAWLERACQLGAFPAPPRDAAGREAWLEAREVFVDESLAWIFSPPPHGWRGLSEVSILHRLAGDQATSQRHHGIVDRLLVGPDRVDIVDYKTNRITPGEAAALAAHYRPQMLAYRDAVAAIYPGRALRCFLLWTAPAMAAARLTEVS